MSNQTSLWLTVEDIRRDLFEYSGVPYPVDPNIVTPKIITEYRLRKSQAKTPVNLDESTENVFICGRGKSLKDGVLKPGEPLIEVNSNIEKQIRQVSGLGYRNEIVEKAFESSDSHSEETETIPNVDDTGKNNLKLVNSSSGAAETECRSEDIKQDHS